MRTLFNDNIDLVCIGTNLTGKQYLMCTDITEIDVGNGGGGVIDL
ncbi:hypothetical protein JCM19235_4701 [Vibrio maritimus]|uniref:Uncharacterized protein n=1 Tax=Vibrio maritimus TaxID=990268 RepID=A0A090S7F3_9VIBR|nr:hypothetical protein JCM19235_4701 [Vibrio maritimus]